MKKIDPGQLITILANIGVIAGIVFLGIELQQNNELLAAESRANSLSQRMNLAYNFLDPEIAELMVRVGEGESLSAAEQIQVAILHEMFFELWEWGYDEAVYGMVELPDSDELSQFRESYRNFPGLDEYWQEKKEYAPSAFRQWIDENVAVE